MTRRLTPQSGLDAIVDSDRQEASLWRRFGESGDATMRERLFDRYRRFARALAHRHARRNGAAGHVVEDLEQFSYRGLLEAIDRFDPVRGPPFPAFAAPRIVGSMADGLASLDEKGAQLRYKRRVERERLASLTASANPRDPRRSATDELAELVTELALGLMLDAEARDARSGFAGRAESGFDNLAWRQTQTLLAERVEALPEPERTVIRQHYLNDLLFTQIAAMLGLTKGRISQLHKSALSKLRKSMRFLQ